MRVSLCASASWMPDTIPDRFRSLRSARGMPMNGGGSRWTTRQQSTLVLDASFDSVPQVTGWLAGWFDLVWLVRHSTELLILEFARSESPQSTTNQPFRLHQQPTLAMRAFATASTIVLASLATAVSGHGYIVDPAAVWTQGYASNGYVSEINNTLWGAVDNTEFGYGVEATVKYFTKNFPTSGYTSLRDLILANQDMYDESTDKECGLTTLDEAKRTTMPASGNITFSGFTHPGPCELWCDDNKLTFANDCAASYPDGKVPFDSAKCVGANKFRIFWIGVHGSPWQVYTNCVYLEGGSGSSSSSSTSTTTPASTAATPVSTTATPTATTATPTANDSDATSTPSPTTKKNCTRRRK